MPVRKKYNICNLFGQIMSNMENIDKERVLLAVPLSFQHTDRNLNTTGKSKALSTPCI